MNENPNCYSLYFHIPFCTKKCDYCHFFVLPNDLALHEKLLRGIKEEWLLRKEQIGNLKLQSIYFGGGTPSLMAPAFFEEILSWLNPDLSIEISLEVNPENASFEKLSAFKKAGVNRLSLGAQSFDDHLLQLLGRTHDHKTTLNTVEQSQKAGFENISIDLMYDLPQQTLQEWERTLKIAANLPITHLSLYNLTIEPNTLFYKRRKELKKEIPSPELSLSMYQTAFETLSRSGLYPYEISAFAKPGFHSIHNTGYWLARPFFGLGPSAYSFWDNVRFKNVSHFNKYVSSLENKALPVDLIDELPRPDRLRELLIIELRLLRGVDLVLFQQRHGLIEANLFAQIQTLIEKGWLTLNNDLLKLTTLGILFYDSIAEELISL